jgi:hypothetical protein
MRSDVIYETYARIQPPVSVCVMRVCSFAFVGIRACKWCECIVMKSMPVSSQRYQVARTS